MQVQMSKTKLKKKVSGILERYEVGDVVEGDDLVFLTKLAEPYVEDLDDVVGYGVGISPMYRTKCFVTIRKDGGQYPFSFRRAIEEKPKEADVLQAFRRSVNGQIHAFKKQHEVSPGWILCSSDQRPVSWDDVQVHHETLFRDLVDDFLDAEEITLKEIDIIVKTDQVLFRSSEFEARWQVFHREHAKLVCLTKSEHKNEH